MVDLGQPSNGREIFGRDLQNLTQLHLGGIQFVHFDERATERHTRRQISRMDFEPGVAGSNRLLIAARSTVLFRELGKSNRRRVRLDPASKLLDARIVWHDRTLRRDRHSLGDYRRLPGLVRDRQHDDEVPGLR